MMKWLSDLLRAALTPGAQRVPPGAGDGREADPEEETEEEEVEEERQQENGPHDGPFNYAVLPDGTAELTAYTGDSGDVFIPKCVTAIGFSAFHGCPGLTVTAASGSFAEQWCIQTGQRYAASL